MIEVEQLTKKYRTTVLDIPHLTITDGQCVGLVGNNGAGKTTFFNLLLDLITATTGHVVNNGVQVDRSEAWKLHTSAHIDESFLIGYLTPEEYFQFIGDLRGMAQAEVERVIGSFTEFFNGEVLGTRKYLRDLSKGNQKKAGIAGAMLGDPSVVILDEPFANLDPSSQMRLKQILKELASRKDITLLISSHDLAHVAEVCERIIVLERGHVVKDITSSASTLRELEDYFAGAGK
jgi:ABC-2 type transport system ATP-binding protein